MKHVKPATKVNVLSAQQLLSKAQLIANVLNAVSIGGSVVITAQEVADLLSKSDNFDNN